jgi:hypothetical protein
MGPTTTNISTSQALDNQPSIDERRALVERVAASEQFRRSTRLRDFLLYVGRQSLLEGCPEINEQEIGTRVFGRPPSYDRSQDNIVRVNATELRKRIELYFTTEGADESLILEIPRGGYRPIFRRRLPKVEDPPAPSLAPLLQAVSRQHDSPSPARTAPRRGTQILLATLSLVLAIACVILFQQNQTMRKSLYIWEGKPAVEAFWVPFLSSHQQTDIVLADASIPLIEDLIGHPVSLADYLSRNYLREVQTSDLSPDRRFDVDRISQPNLVAFGDYRAGQQILALTPISSSLHLTFSRYYTADSFKRNNVILIGGQRANPWIGLFHDQMNFSLGFDAAHPHGFVTNRNPKKGEQTIYAAPADPDTLVGYSIIAFLPNPSRTGAAILLAGTDSDATNAAAEFLTSEEHMEKLKSTFGVQSFPYFETLLKTSRLNGTSLNAELIAYKTYPSLR